MVTAVASTKSKAASSVDLHTCFRGVSRRSERNFDSSKSRPENRNVQSQGGLLVSNLFLSQIADYCEFGEGHRNYSFKKRIIDFLKDRKKAGDLKNAIFFLYNLETLSNLRNHDGSNVKGVERIFENAQEAVEKGDNVHGFYFEAIAALSLMEAGFSIKEVSVRQIERNGIVEELIDSHGSPREIDFIAEKDLGEGVQKIFCDAKSSVVSMILSNDQNKQMGALVEIANKYGALPAIILKTREAKVSSDGSIDCFQPIAIKPKDKRQIFKFLTSYPELLIWDESGNNIVSNEEVDSWREERRILNEHKAFRKDDKSYKLPLDLPLQTMRKEQLVA